MEFGRDRPRPRLSGPGRLAAAPPGSQPPRGPAATPPPCPGGPAPTRVSTARRTRAGPAPPPNGRPLSLSPAPRSPPTATSRFYSRSSRSPPSPLAFAPAPSPEDPGCAARTNRAPERSPQGRLERSSSCGIGAVPTAPRPATPWKGETGAIHLRKLGSRPLRSPPPRFTPRTASRERCHPARAHTVEAGPWRDRLRRRGVGRGGPGEEGLWGGAEQGAVPPSGLTFPSGGKRIGSMPGEAGPGCAGPDGGVGAGRVCARCILRPCAYPGPAPWLRRPSVLPSGSLGPPLTRPFSEKAWPRLGAPDRWAVHRRDRFQRARPLPESWNRTSSGARRL